MRTIVVGVDGSETSLRALKFAADLANDLRDPQLLVVFARHVYLAMPEHAAEDLFADVLDQVEATIRQNTATVLEHSAAPWLVITREGEPADVLCAVAKENGASFIVAGRRGWTTAAELLLGSVSNRLVHRAECAVLLVPDA
ncbi:MAG TPA: universal stress protein [Acidimicrobiales bacterium]|nr:universal stress protein [Acidimicrobiales bacterium]